MVDMEIFTFARVVNSEIWSILHNINIYGGKAASFVTYASESWDGNQYPDLILNPKIIDFIQELQENEDEFPQEEIDKIIELIQQAVENGASYIEVCKN